MELTGEAYWSFRTWIFDAQGIKPKFIDDLNDRLLQCYIIEWLDSVDIYITITSGNVFGKRPFFWSIESDESGLISYGSPHNDRQQATERAIERAVELFNEK